MWNALIGFDKKIVKFFIEKYFSIILARKIQ